MGYPLTRVCMTYKCALCVQVYANLNNRRCNLKFKNKNVDRWPPRGLVCCVVLYGGGCSQIISGHLERPAGASTYVSEGKKRIKFRDFTNRFVLTRFGSYHVYTNRTYYILLCILTYIPLRHILL